MSAGRHHTYREIREVGQALESVRSMKGELRGLAEETVRRSIRRVIAVGCGTSYYAAIGGLYPLVHSEIDAYPLPSSELFLSYLDKVDRRSLVVGLSRSGRTAETLEALRLARERGAFTIGLTCTLGSDIAKVAEAVLEFEVREESVVMTKSFSALTYALLGLSSSILALQGLEPLREWDAVPEYAERPFAVEEDVKNLASEMASRSPRSVVFMGSGPDYALALEGALKLMETSYTPTTAIHALEFRHGPMSLVGEEVDFVLVYTGEVRREVVQRIVDDIEGRGGRVLAVTSDPELHSPVRVFADLRLKGVVSLPLAIVPLQLLAYYHCVFKGLNPDRPRHLVKYVGRF